LGEPGKGVDTIEIHGSTAPDLDQAIITGGNFQVRSGPVPGVVSATLYADGSISCAGADDLSDPDGITFLVPVTGGVKFWIYLEGAEPNRTYNVAISQEDTCASAEYYPGAITTDTDGNGSFSSLYPVTSGTYNLLVNMVTSATGLSDPKHREIGTTDAWVTVP
jgi:hypothetical protein